MSKDVFLKDVTVHTMVKNGSPYIRQALISVLPYVSRAICIDTGSNDSTLEYLVKLQEKFPHLEVYSSPVQGDSIKWDGNHLSQSLTDVRNKMIDMTSSKWIMQLDDDEIYPENSILTLANALNYISTPGMEMFKGLMVKIKWCTSDIECADQGPFPKTLRIFQNGGKWIGKFPDEFYYLDGQPIFINDIRCQTVRAYFLHMSLKLHPERRPVNGQIIPLTADEQKILQWSE